MPDEKHEILESQGRMEARLTKKIEEGDAAVLKVVTDLADDSKDAIKLASGFDALSKILTFLCTVAVAIAGIYEFTK